MEYPEGSLSIQTLRKLPTAAPTIPKQRDDFTEKTQSNHKDTKALSPSKIRLRFFNLNMQNS